MRRAVFFYLAQTTDARTTGIEEITMNGNFDGWRPDLMGPGSGQMWGTLVFKVADATGKPTGEVWEGTWTGTRTVTGDVAQSVIKAVAHGTGGTIEGLKANWEVTLDPTSGVGVIEGRILAPPGKAR